MNKLDSIIGAISDPKLREMLENLKQQLKQKMDIMKAEIASAKSKQQQAYASAIVKISKSVKTMKVRDFNELNNCDIIQIVKMIRSQADGTTDAVVGVARARPQLAASTPGPLRRSQRNLMTPSRTVRRGEKLFSKNGSPLESGDEGALIATVMKKPRADGLREASFDLNVGGRCISLGDPESYKSLDSEMKSMAVSRLMVLKDQVEGLLKYV